jgi:hypothetical protein
VNLAAAGQRGNRDFCSLFFRHAGFHGKITVDIPRQSDKFYAQFMKSETTNTVLNLVLAVLVISGVFFALWTIQRTREFRELNPVAVQANAKLMMMQSFVNDVSAYNNQVKSPEITRMLQPLLTKPAAH